MLLVRRRPAGVAGCFVVGVITDLLDGPLARRFGTESDRGARLDSVADAVFVAAFAISASTTVDEASRPWVGRSAWVIAATRFAALLVTHRRFGVWSVMLDSPWSLGQCECRFDDPSQRLLELRSGASEIESDAVTAVGDELLATFDEYT